MGREVIDPSFYSLYNAVLVAIKQNMNIVCLPKMRLFKIVDSAVTVQQLFRVHFNVDRRGTVHGCIPFLDWLTFYG